MWMRVVDRPGARVFASLNAVEALSRALIAGILPLEAERLIQDALRISVLYTVIGVVAFLSSFLVPLAMRRLPRRWIFSLGVACMVVAPLLLMLASAGWFSAALQFRAFAVVAVNIALNLYILDYIRRRDFVSSEPIRLAYLGGAWCVGPALGIYLYTTYGLAAVCLPSAACAVLALAYFWVLRLREHPTVAPARGAQPMPWQYLRRYLRQPRLRLAWFIPFGRSTFWTSFFVYPPIYIVRNGGDEVMVAVMLSGGQALLFIAPFFGRLLGAHDAKLLQRHAVAVDQVKRVPMRPLVHVDQRRPVAHAVGLHRIPCAPLEQRQRRGNGLPKLAIVQVFGRREPLVRNADAAVHRHQ